MGIHKPATASPEGTPMADQRRLRSGGAQGMQAVRPPSLHRSAVRCHRGPHRSGEAVAGPLSLPIPLFVEVAAQVKVASVEGFADDHGFDAETFEVADMVRVRDTAAHRHGDVGDA